MSEEEIQAPTEKSGAAPLSESMKYGVGTFLTIGAIDLLAHLGPTGLVVGALSALVAGRHGPEMYAQVRGLLPDLPERQLHKGGRSFWDRAMGRFLDGEKQDSGLAQEDILEESNTARHQRDRIDLAADLHIHKNDIAGKAIFVCGIRRHGKTTLGARLAEQLGRYYIPMFIPDLEGDYISLADVLPRAIIAGHPSVDQQYVEYDFVPLDSTRAAFQLGYDILEVGCQVILDMGSYVALDQAVAIQVNIIRGMFHWANEHPIGRVPAYVYLDEAQRFLPQNLNDSVIKNKELVQVLLDAYMDIIAIGGKRGINPVVLTQRFAQVNNKIMAQSEVFFLMRQTHDGDLKRCLEYVSAPITKEQISKFQPGEGVYIAADGTQQVAQFHQRESSGKRSSTPQADAAQRYAAMPKRLGNGSFTAFPDSENPETPVYKKQRPVKPETPIYRPINGPVNGSTSTIEPLPANPHLHLLVNEEALEIEHKEAEEPSVNVNVNAETRKIIKRMVDMGGIPHNKIAKAVGLDGRNYPTYKQVCKEMGIATEKEA